jgi:2-octaprenyl-6-methoxyphenol hydroxylase
MPSLMPPLTLPTYDIVIVGAGPVGLALAAMLAQRWGDKAYRIALLEATPETPLQAADQRVLALSEATRLRLAPFFFPEDAVPMHRIHVSEQGALGRVELNAQALGLPALGWTVRYGTLVQGLWHTVKNLGVTVLRPARALSPVPKLANPTDWCAVQLEGGQTLTCAVRVDAEGGMFEENTQARDIKVNYEQNALVADVDLVLDDWSWPQTGFGRSPSQGWAFERFTPQGPLALLPIQPLAMQPSALSHLGSKANAAPLRYSLVWCGSPELTQRRLAMSQAELQQHLHAALGRRVRILAVGQRKSFGLGLNWRRTLVHGRCVAIGNAAQILHPVAGQGLNLGLRDAQGLAHALSPVFMHKPQALAEALAGFERARAPDRRCVLALSHGLVKGFGSPCSVAAGLRRALFQGLEALPPLKTEFAQLMVYGWLRG